MSTPSLLGERYLMEPLGSSHDRSLFSSGEVALDRYLRQQASQDGRRKVASVFVAVEKASGAVHGFYTLSMASVLLDRLSPFTLFEVSPITKSEVLPVGVSRRLS